MDKAYQLMTPSEAYFFFSTWCSESNVKTFLYTKSDISVFSAKKK